MSEAKFFGYWVPVTDKASATAAVRMAGLPVLIMGGNAALLALIAAVQPVPDTVLIASAAALAAVLVLIAFRLRGGHAAWIPITFLLFVAFLALHLFLAYSGWLMTGTTLEVRVQIFFGWIVPVICLILMVSGFSGRQWLRKNGEKLSF